MTARSWLYVPGDRPDLLAKSAGRDADALILDLEDAVAPSEKVAARRHVAAHLAAVDSAPERWVRVNGTSIEDDVDAVIGANLTGIVLAKAEPSRLGELDTALSRAEARSGLTGRPLPVVALVETAVAVMQLAAVARSPRVRQLALGEADLGAQLGLEASPPERLLDPIRLQAVVASAAAGIAAPIGPVSTDFRDLDALRASTVALSTLGFRSRQTIHPDQVRVVNEVFTPTPDEIARAERLVADFERADERGHGVLVDDAGRMVDLAVVRSARNVLDRRSRG